MARVDALVHDPAAPHGLRFADVPAPSPAGHQALVETAAVSLNFGEVAFLSAMRRPGEVPGWDAAGVVVAAAADGSGPPPGTRVVTFGWAGGWARRRAVDTAELAAVPEGVELAAAAALPVAGVTALRAVRRLGAIVGRRVLVTGASGGVGRFAVQIAARAGAHVIASVGRPERGEGLAALGAAEVVVGLEGVTAPVAGALDTVGGARLAEAFALLEPGGSVQSVGMASREPTTIDFEEARRRGGSTRIEAFALEGGLGADVAFLAGELAAGRLDPQIGWRGPWARAGDAVEALLGRAVAGKAVLELEPAP
jgi:NADPH:quinone reductase